MLVDERLLVILGLTEEELKQQHLYELAHLAYDKGYEFKTDFNAITMEFTITMVPIVANASLEFLKQRFPGIYKACLLIALDNNGIHCDRSEEDMAKELYDFMAERHKTYNLPEIDTWLNALSAEVLTNVCSGEEAEITAAMVGSPENTNQFLQEYFDEVC